MKFKLKTLPIIIFLTYLILTFIMYLFSPLGWEKMHINEMILFNIIIWTVIYKGFMMGVNKRQPCGQHSGYNINSKYWYFFSILSIIAAYLDLQVIFQKSDIGLHDFFVFQFNFSLGDGYDSVLNKDFAFGNITSLLYQFSKPIAYTYVFVTIFKWSQCNLYHKSIVIFYIFTHIMGYISIGTNKGVFDFILSIPLIIVASKGQLESIYKIPIKYILVLIAMAFSAFVLFGAVISSRSEGQEWLKNPITSADINYDATIFKLIPEQYHKSYIILDFYLTHAYNNMDVAMDLPYEPCYGLGNSPILLQHVKKLGIGNDISSKTYEARVSKYYGVSSGLWWYTAYVAFANDVSFFGVPFVIMLLAYLFGRLWGDAIQAKYTQAVPLLYLMIICFFYLNANNQIFGKSQFIPFCFLFIVWRLSKKTIR